MHASVTGQRFSIGALCFEAEWGSIAMSARVELLSVDGAPNIRCGEEGTSQEIRSATSKPSLGRCLAEFAAFQVFCLRFFYPLFFVFSFLRAGAAVPQFNSFLIACELQKFCPLPFF